MIRFTSRTGMLGLALSGLLFGASSVQAGLLSANSGGAIPGFTGTQLFDEFFAPFPSFSVDASVDFAVFAPGAFGAAFPGEDPSGGTDYVYAYQIDNFGNEINKLTVGLDGDESLGAIGFIADIGAVDPSASLYVGAGPTSSAWDFSPGTLGTGTTSALLFFTSDAAPELHSSTVATNFAATHDLPSPLPEPASLSLFLMGASLIGLKRRPRA